MQAKGRHPRKTKHERLAARRIEAIFGGIPKDVRAVTVGKDQAAILRDQFSWKTCQYSEIKQVTPLAVFRPFAVRTEISNGRFDLNDAYHAIFIDSDHIAAPSVREYHLGQNSIVQIAKISAHAPCYLARNIVFRLHFRSEPPFNELDVTFCSTIVLVCSQDMATLVRNETHIASFKPAIR
ncbi:MAG TPA: hypothetical protein VKA94_14865 [Hyphomicrobiales bacterium]|nr:hypothetical protein [Hyphomicrobiales bacterium]